MRTIHKYLLALQDEQKVQLPRGAEVLMAQTQKLQHLGESIVIWALVETDNPMEERTFCVLGTGQQIQAGEIGLYLGTVQMSNGALVWHIFEKEAT